MTSSIDLDSKIFSVSLDFPVLAPRAGLGPAGRACGGAAVCAGAGAFHPVYRRHPQGQERDSGAADVGRLVEIRARGHLDAVGVVQKRHGVEVGL